MNEAADPTLKEPENETNMDPARRVRTKYMHANVNRQRDGIIQNELDNSQGIVLCLKFLF